jgi:hypothetical protein
MKKHLFRVLVYTVIIVGTSITVRNISHTTASSSWSSKTQNELRTAAEVSRIEKAIRVFRKENGYNPCPTNTQIYRQILDPWGNPYHIEIAALNESNIVVSGTEIRTSVAVWSNGKNKKNEFGEGDDICSWKTEVGRTAWHQWWRKLLGR